MFSVVGENLSPFPIDGRQSGRSNLSASYFASRTLRRCNRRDSRAISLRGTVNLIRAVLATRPFNVITDHT